LFRHSARDGWLVGAAGVQGVLALATLPLVAMLPVAGLAPAAGIWAIGLWWNSNTIAHIHLHNPVFRQRWQNVLFAAWLSMLTGIPQTIWRERHLWHHAGEPPGPKIRRMGAIGWLEVALVGLTWAALFTIAPRFFALCYLPGYLLGLLMCQLQGRYEHLLAGSDAPAGISHYGRFYNVFWFNDGYHAEHHRWPGAHWSELPARRLNDSTRSGWPPVLRWLRDPSDVRVSTLAALERLARDVPLIGGFMVRSHRRALRRLLPKIHTPTEDIRRVCVVGGGLFPRTVLALAPVLPEARFTIVDADAAHLGQARTILAQVGLADRVILEQRYFGREDPTDAEVVVLPLAFEGDLESLLATWRGPPIVTHDWLWQRRGSASVVISLWLLKRMSAHRPS